MHLLEWRTGLYYRHPKPLTLICKHHAKYPAERPASAVTGNLRPCFFLNEQGRASFLSVAHVSFSLTFPNFKNLLKMSACCPRFLPPSKHLFFKEKLHPGNMLTINSEIYNILSNICGFYVNILYVIL